MVIEIACMALIFMVIGTYLGYKLGKAKSNVKIVLPEWLHQ